MQVQGQHAVSTRSLDKVSNQLSGYGRTRCGFAILPSVAVVGNYRRDAPCRTPPQSIDHNQQLHEVVIGRHRGRLEDKNVFAAHILFNFNKDFAVIKAPQIDFAELDFELVTNGPRQGLIGAAAGNDHGSIPLAPDDYPAFGLEDRLQSALL